MKLDYRLALVLVIVVSLALPAAAAAQGPCATTSINVREGPGGGYRRTSVVNRGECITVLGLSQDGQWYQVQQGWAWAAPHLWSDTGGQPAPSGAPGAASAPASGGAVGGHVVTSETWLTDPAPAPFTDVVAYVLVHVDGAPRAGIPVQFAWKFRGGTETCGGVTDAMGAAACLQNVGATPPGELVYVQASFQAYGRSHSLVSSFAVNGNCDLSYPDFCLPRTLTTVQCRDIPYRNFLVLPPDSHGFDPDGDTLGCET